MPTEPVSAGDYRMPFGSYRNKTLRIIYNCDPGYLTWALDNLKARNVVIAIQEFYAEQRKEIIDRGKRKRPVGNWGSL